MFNRNISILLGLIFLLISCKDKEVFTGTEEIELDGEALGKLVITSDPPNAKIFLNNKNMGVLTPDTLRFLPFGSYKITLKHPYFLDSTFSTEINSPVKKEIFVNYRANVNNYARIYCNSSPQGALISINDSLTNEVTPHTFAGLYPGIFKIKVTYPEYRSDSSSVTLLGGRIFDTYYTLEDTTEWVSYKYHNSDIGDNYFQSIEVDNSGNIWFGSMQSGVSFFDKKKFYRINSINSIIPDNSINAIKADKNGSVWIGTNKGIVKYQNGSWTNYSNSIFESNVRSIDFDSKGNIWVATLSGVFKFDGAKWDEFSTRTYPAFFKDNMFSSITVGNDDRIWIGTSNKGILVYNGISWINFDINAMGLDPLMGNNVSEIKSDGKGKIWIGLVPNMKFQNIRGGIVEFDGVKWKEIKFSGIGVTLFQDFYFYKGKGYLSTQSGFAIFDESYNIDLYNIFNSKIPTADIRAIKRDKSGALWLVTMNGAMKIKNIPN